MSPEPERCRTGASLGKLHGTEFLEPRPAGLEHREDTASEGERPLLRPRTLTSVLPSSSVCGDACLFLHLSHKSQLKLAVPLPGADGPCCCGAQNWGLGRLASISLQKAGEFGSEIRTHLTQVTGVRVDICLSLCVVLLFIVGNFSIQMKRSRVQ